MTTEDLVRVTVTLPGIDVDLLDRLATLEGLNCSAELRVMLAQLRPMLRATVEAFEAAAAQRDKLTDASGAVEHIERLLGMAGDVEKMQDEYLGTMGRIEAAASSHAARQVEGEK